MLLTLSYNIAILFAKIINNNFIRDLVSTELFLEWNSLEYALYFTDNVYKEILNHFNIYLVIEFIDENN